MKILRYSVTFLPHIGGLEYNMHSLSNVQARAGHQVKLLTHILESDQQARSYSLYRKKIWSIPFCHSISQRQVYWQIRHLHFKYAFDIMHVHGVFSSAFLASLAAKRLNIPMVVTCHGDHLIPNDFGIVNWQEHPKARKQVIEGLKACDILILPNPELEEILQPLLQPLPRIHVIPHGHNALLPRKGTRENPDDIHLISIARNAPVKQMPWMLERLAPILSKYNRLKLTVIGADYKKIKNKYEDILGSQVQFTGIIPHNQVEQHLQNSDIFLCPSVYESFSLATAEALRHNVVPLCRNALGFRNLIKHEFNGLLFDGSQDGDFEFQLMRLIDEQHLRHQLKEGTKKCTGTIPWEQSVELHVQAYQDAQSQHFDTAQQ
jgi:1,2-diacylglycerol 3-alpha-glucosyltransferase